MFSQWGQSPDPSVSSLDRRRFFVLSYEDVFYLHLRFVSTVPVWCLFIFVRSKQVRQFAEYGTIAIGTFWEESCMAESLEVRQRELAAFASESTAEFSPGSAFPTINCFN
jgi:hypothetical protein